MTAVIVLVTLGVLGAALTAGAYWFRSDSQADLGSVSHTWIAELRAGDPYDSSR